MWKTLTSHKIGWEHKKAGKVCQDRFLVRHIGQRLLLAVADGHGGAPYSRSLTGARLACQAAEKVFSVPQPDYNRAHLLIKGVFDWLVREHLERFPLNPEEQALLGQAPGQYAYGTTLICAVLEPQGVYRYHLGDGELHIVDANGRLMAPLPEDPDCVCGFTTSLVEDTAPSDARWEYTPVPAAAAILFTDGYDCGTPVPWQLLSLLETLPEEIPQQLLRAGTNGDDQTVVIGAAPGLCVGVGKMLEKQRRYAELMEQADQLQLQVKEQDMHLRYWIKKLESYTSIQERETLVEKVYSCQKRFCEQYEKHQQALLVALQAKGEMEAVFRPQPFFQHLNSTYALQIEPETIRQIYGAGLVEQMAERAEEVEENIRFLLAKGLADTVSDICNRFAPSLLEDSVCFAEKAEALFQSLGPDYGEKLAEDMTLWEAML